MTTDPTPLVTVVIPTYEAASFLDRLVPALAAQTLVHEVLVIDSNSRDRTVDIARQAGWRVHQIDRQDFDHGGTRNLGVRMARSESVVFLTQDALPADPWSLEELVSPLAEPGVAAVCGRQLPARGANPLAEHARLFNYPSVSMIKTRKDIPAMGLKAAFLSNSFAAYRKSVLEEIGGFPRKIILGEDMHAAARMILAGYKVAYAGGARVYHSHNYSPVQEFARYFDIGVFHAREPWILARFGKVNGEGLRYVRSEMVHVGNRPGWLVRSVIGIAFKFAGYQLGRRERIVPGVLRQRMGMNKGFWRGRERRIR